MEEHLLRFQRELFSNLQINLDIALYSHVGDTWRDIDYVPMYNKFYLICDGEGWLKIGGREFYPKPGQLFLLPEGVQQSYSVINNNTFKKYWCHFTAKIGDIDMFAIVDTPYFIDVENFDGVKALFEELVEVQDNPKIHARLREKILLTELISYYLETINEAELKLSGFSAMEKLNVVLKHIQDHMSEDITVEDLAARLHFHPNYFTRIFKKYIGISPIHYIVKVRIEKAKYLLRTSQASIGEIASATGFCDIYHFSKTFKHYTGFTPTDFRKINCF